MNNKLAVITGASSGIGHAIAVELHQRGYNVHLVARRQNRLEENCALLNSKRANSASFSVLDLVIPEHCQELELYLSSQPVSLLVNNVGRGSFGDFSDLSRAQESDMVVLNSIVPLRLAHAVIPGLKEKKEGGIIFISSIAAFQPLPFMATYSATKAFNLQQSLALREELKPFNINVTAVCPGPVATEFGGVARVPGTVTGGKRDTAQMVAVEAINAYQNKQAVVIPGFKAKMFALGSKLFPQALSTKIVGYLINPSRLNP